MYFFGKLKGVKFSSTYSIILFLRKIRLSPVNNKQSFHLFFEPKIAHNKIIIRHNNLHMIGCFDVFTKIYRGYVDDPRNTDNAWMETIAYNFHDDTGESVGQLKLHAGLLNFCLFTICLIIYSL